MAADAYHAHLDGCPRCAGQPFNQCPEGARLLREAVMTGPVTDGSTAAQLMIWRSDHLGERLEGQADAQLLKIIQGLKD